MKKLVFMMIALSIAISTNAQSDTTKIRMGNKKIIIIDESNKNSDDFKKGKTDFEKSISENNSKIKKLNDSIARMNEMISKENDAAKKSQLKTSIEEMNTELVKLNKENEILNKNLKQIDNEIADMKKELKDDDENKTTRVRKSRSNDDFDDWWGSKWWRRKSRPHFDGHWAGFEFGLNNYVNSSFGSTLPTENDGQLMELNSSKSWEFALNFIEYSIPLFKENFGFVTGLGIQWNNYRFKKNIDLYEDANGIIRPVEISTNIKNYNHNSLNTIYLNVPFIMEFQTSGRRVFNVGFGVVGGIKLSSKTKQYYEFNGHEIEDVFCNDLQIPAYRYGFTFRIGYGILHLYANYSATPLFKKGKGPELYPITFGITLLDF